MSSYDVVRHFKRHLPQGFGKIGHFGTLDPFASGVLMIGIAGAARLNDLIHEFMPKTYLAVGKLGIETPTGDYTSEITQQDLSPYLTREMANWSASFIEDRIRQKFLGDYWQAPHQYSATKFMGKNLHEWAREGVEIKKEPVLRKVYDLQVVKYAFPYLSIRATVSSGTYIRTLFNEIAQDLGTIGSLIALVRESVGAVDFKSALKPLDWPQNRADSILKSALTPDAILPFKTVGLNERQALLFKNGGFLKDQDIGTPKDKYIWFQDDTKNILGLSELIETGHYKPKINFHLGVQDETSSGSGPL
jgi:tRNA pseudouridine55 synthase